jgi:hypothetical protein
MRWESTSPGDAVFALLRARAEIMLKSIIRSRFSASHAERMSQRIETEYRNSRCTILAGERLCHRSFGSGRSLRTAQPRSFDASSPNSVKTVKSAGVLATFDGRLSSDPLSCEERRAVNSSCFGGNSVPTGQQAMRSRNPHPSIRSVSTAPPDSVAPAIQAFRADPPDGLVGEIRGNVTREGRQPDPAPGAASPAGAWPRSYGLASHIYARPSVSTPVVATSIP